MLVWIPASSTAADWTLPEFGDKVNLALRRTADKVLRASGDSTSRIPAVEKVGTNTWRVRIDKEFNYDQLPQFMIESLKQYGITKAYQVAVRRCVDDVIDLGFHIQDIQSDSVAPCMGREESSGCHYIEVTFTDNSAEFKEPFLTNKATLSVIALLSVLGLIYVFWKKPTLPGDEVALDDPNWIPIGQSKLNVNGQVLKTGDHIESLTYREAKLLGLFAAHQGELLEREFILRNVWEDEGIQVGRSVDVFVSRLRKKLGHDAMLSISAVHGVGYKLEVG